MTWLALLFALPSTVSQETEDEMALLALALESPPAMWEPFVNLRSSAGYHDNLLLTKTHRIGSPYLSAAADVFIWRYPSEETEAQGFLSAERKQYLSGDPVDHEQSLLAYFEATKRMRPSWQIGYTAQYFFQDQLFDDSVTDTRLGTVQAKGHNIRLSPSIEWQRTDRQAFRLELHAERQFFKEPLDDFWQFGPELSLEQSLREGSTLTLSTAFYQRPYESRSELSDDGFTTPLTRLNVRRYELGAEWEREWGSDRRWRNRARVQLRTDDGSGSAFYDYRRLEFREQLRYRTERWTATIEARLARYQYQRQTIAIDNPERRAKDRLILGADLKRQITDNLSAKLSWEYERSASNLSFDDYRAHHIALEWDWEL